MKLRDKLRRWCLEESYACLLVVYNSWPLLIGFIGGLAGALLPYVALMAAAPKAAYNAMVVLANAAAGASAGIAAATARRPARIEDLGPRIHGTHSSALISTLVRNASDVYVQKAVAVIDRVEAAPPIIMLYSKPGGGLVLESSRTCKAVCASCVVEGAEAPIFYSTAPLPWKMKPGSMVQWRMQAEDIGVEASIPPGGVVEAPIATIHVLDTTKCRSWRGCSEAVQAALEGCLLVLRVLSIEGPEGRPWATLAAPCRRSLRVTLHLRIAGDPLPTYHIPLTIEASSRSGVGVEAEACTPRSCYAEALELEPLRCVEARA